MLLRWTSNPTTTSLTFPIHQYYGLSEAIQKKFFTSRLDRTVFCLLRQVNMRVCRLDIFPDKTGGIPRNWDRVRGEACWRLISIDRTRREKVQHNTYIRRVSFLCNPSNMGYTTIMMQPPTRTRWGVKRWMGATGAQNDTMHRSNIYNDAKHLIWNICVSLNAKQTLPLARNMPRCLEDGSAWEPTKGAASRDTASGKRKQP